MAVRLDRRQLPGLNAPRGGARAAGDPSGAGPVQAMPGHLVRRLQQIAVRLFAEVLGDALTPVQFAALAAIAGEPGMDQAALSARIGYDRATIGGVIDRLQRRGLLERVPDPADRRLKRVHLTGAGQQLLAASLPVVADVQRQLLGPLTEREQASFERICRKLLDQHHG